jgi:hypothetical protein
MSDTQYTVYWCSKFDVPVITTGYNCKLCSAPCSNTDHQFITHVVKPVPNQTGSTPFTCLNCQHEMHAHSYNDGRCLFQPGTLYTTRTVAHERDRVMKLLADCHAYIEGWRLDHGGPENQKKTALGVLATLSANVSAGSVTMFDERADVY